MYNNRDNCECGEIENCFFYEHLRGPTGVHFPWSSWGIKVPCEIVSLFEQQHWIKV